MLDAVDVAGRVVWSRTDSVTVPRSQSGSSFTSTSLAFGVIGDLDGDVGLEGVLEVAVETEDDNGQRASRDSTSIVRSVDGTRLTDSTSDFLFGGVTRVGQNRVLVKNTHPGLVVSVLRGKDSARRFATLVPASQGVPSGFAWAAVLGTTPCSDVLVSGAGRGRAVVAVLASNGQPRWSVGRPWADPASGAVHLSKTAPRPCC